MARRGKATLEEGGVVTPELEHSATKAESRRGSCSPCPATPT